MIKLHDTLKGNMNDRIRMVVQPTIDWIHDDFKSNSFRFCVELFAWSISLGCAITMAMTVPNPPLLQMYPVWILGCAMYAWASYSRKSFGMLVNYMLLVTIDSIGLYRLLA
jgi:hypothetical protein